MTIPCDAVQQTRVLSELQQPPPITEVVGNVADQITIGTLRHIFHQVPLLFEPLEAEAAGLRPLVPDWPISGSTLEGIFLKIAVQNNMTNAEVEDRTEANRELCVICKTRSAGLVALYTASAQSTCTRSWRQASRRRTPPTWEPRGAGPRAPCSVSGCISCSIARGASGGSCSSSGPSCSASCASCYFGAPVECELRSSGRVRTQELRARSCRAACRASPWKELRSSANPGAPVECEPGAPVECEPRSSGRLRPVECEPRALVECEPRSSGRLRPVRQARRPRR